MATEMTTETRTFVPALRFDWLTPLYDPILAALLRERAWKTALVEQVNPGPGERILDVGCGTGTLTMLLKRAAPKAEIVGLDPDPKVLSRARRKASATGLDIAFLHGSADEPRSGEPFAPASFDKAVSSLMLHHLLPAAKRRTLANLRSLLREKGELHIADWGKPGNMAMRALFLPVQLLDGFETTADNVRGRLPAFLREAGFKDVEETRRWPTPLGSLSFYRARKA